MANFTGKAIMSNFEDMLREMAFDKITVTALVERCEISSNTFYYHYRDIFELLDEWIKSKFSKYPNGEYLGENWIQTMKQLLYEIRDNKEIVRHIYSSISREQMERYLFDTIEEDVYKEVCIRTKGKAISEKKVHLIAGMYCYTMFGFLMKYIWTGMQADVDDYIDDLGEMLESCIKLYLEKK